MATISNILALPGSPFQGSGFVGVVITSGIPSYFELTGTDLDQIVSVQWLPANPSSVVYEMRQLILVDNTRGTFMVRVLDNLLNNCDRAGKIIFRLDDGDTLSFPVKTYGPVSVGPLWTAPGEGLITG
jgi:hypothetical protein